LIKDVLPVYMSGFFLAVLLGAVFSSFNSLLNSAATLFCLDVYEPLKKGKVGDAEMIKVAKIASIAIAVFSFVVAPLLQYAPEGLWQVIRIFTGFYNIPVVAVVMVGLFTKRVPGLGAKVAIVFHIVAYGLLQFVFNDAINIHFLHLYAILFFAEIAIMLVIGYLKPMEKPWVFEQRQRVNLVPWAYALPVSITLFSCIVALYVLFSPLGLVGGLGPLFWPALLLIAILNIGGWYFSRKRWSHRYSKYLLGIADT
jgi:SSS family solute:Na+ symporter